MSRLRRLAFSLLGAVVIPAVTLVTVVTVSAAAPSAPKGKAATPVAHKRPCTAFSGCASATNGSSVTSSAVLSSPRLRSHSHCTHGRAKPSGPATSAVDVTVSSARPLG
jgi:hypothetical protein